MIVLLKLIKMAEEIGLTTLLSVICREMYEGFDFESNEEFNEWLTNYFEIELTESQLDSLTKVIRNGKYKSAFALHNLTREA